MPRERRVEVEVGVEVEVESMKWPTRQDVFWRESCVRRSTRVVGGPSIRRGIGQSKRELRAVAIEYSRSLPHRLGPSKASQSVERDRHGGSGSLTRPPVIAFSGQR